MSNPTKPDVKSLLAQASALRWELGNDFHEHVSEALYKDAAAIATKSVTTPKDKPRFYFDKTLDKIITSRIWGFPIMILLLALVFWLTISLANIPSAMLSGFLIDTLQPLLKEGLAFLQSPWWLTGFLVDGVYLATAWVISVMLPPMAIFFPLFTLLEDFGYLPRVAFNLDSMFRKAGGHGRQSLSMVMGFGCNAAGIVATRIIDSPRERLIAIITNNFALCNGRWPTQILISTVFIGSMVPPALAGLVSAGAVVAIALLGVLFTFLVSLFLSKTILKGEQSTFSLELPPYRPPRILQTLYTSIIDRTLIVLWRAILFAAPAGAVIWLISNVNLGDLSVAHHLINFLNPAGVLLGLNGIILVAYIVAIPANEIVIPTILMLSVLVTGNTELGAGAGVMFELDSVNDLLTLLAQNGWTLLTAINLMLFSLIHNPCSTTIVTIYKETKSAKWTIISALLPLGMGFVVTFAVAQVWRLFTG